jgi:MFS transporter, ACS family, allantoate permease
MQAGMCESCVAPLLILLISMFYRKNEQASRISWFYVMVAANAVLNPSELINFQNGLTQVFGGFVAYVSKSSVAFFPFNLISSRLGDILL